MCGDRCSLARPARPAASRRTAHALCRDSRLAPGVEEHRARRRRRAAARAQQRLPAAHEVGVQRLAGVAAQRDHPLLAALAAQPHGARLEVEVVEVEPDRLGDPRAGAVEHLQQGAVPQRLGGPGRAGRLEQSARPRRPPIALGSRCGAAGGRTPREGSVVASPSRAANRWNPRTATTVRAAEAADRAAPPSAPERSAARNSADVPLAHGVGLGEPAGPAERAVAPQVAAVRRHGVAGQPALDRQVVEVGRHRGVERTGPALRRSPALRRRTRRLHPGDASGVGRQASTSSSATDGSPKASATAP